MTSQTAPALVVLSHGSTLCGAADTVREHARRLAASGEWSRVAVAFLNYTPPRFAEVAASLAAQGVQRIVVLPYFLVPGKFVRENLQREVEEARRCHPQLAISVAAAIGYDPALADAIAQLAAHAMPPDHWHDELERAAAACEERPDCPLYGRPPCRARPTPKEPAS
jgi:sirohydrochlorin cobaltochelatase